MKGTLIDNLRYIKKVLKMPYHRYDTSTVNPALTILIIEDKDANRRSFSGRSMWNAAEEALMYIQNEIKMGSLKEPVETKASAKKDKGKKEEEAE